jgi:hypothetical protein
MWTSIQLGTFYVVRAIQDSYRFPLNPQVHYCVQNFLSPGSVLNQKNPFYILTLHFLRLTLILSSLLCLCHSTGLFLSDFRTVCLYDFISYPFMLHLPSISILIRSSSNWYIVKSTIFWDGEVHRGPCTSGGRKKNKELRFSDSKLLGSPDIAQSNLPPVGNCVGLEVLTAMSMKNTISWTLFILRIFLCYM